MITLHGENDLEKPSIEILNGSHDALIEALQVYDEVFLEESKEMWAKTIANKVVEVFCALRRARLSGYEEGVKELFNKCLRLALDTMCKENFAIDRNFAFQCAEYSTLIGNLAEICGWPTTQEYIEKVREQPNSLYKIMVLTSTRNDEEQIEELLSQYDVDIPLFNNWVSSLFLVAGQGLLDPRIERILDRVEDEICKHDFVWGMSMGDLYNTSTYRQSPCEKRLKTHISKNFQNTFVSAKKLPNKKTGKIAIYSENWFEGHSTHRTVAKYIKALEGKYDFTLLYGERLKGILNNREDDYKMFSEKHHIAAFGVFDPLELNIVGPSDLDIDMIIFPDAGYDVLSVILANMRIAPVQVSMTGFPSSIFGGKIDYFISGREVDDPKYAEHNYDEKLVLLPGFGAIHTRQEEKFDFVPPQPKDDILVGGCWVGPKTNYKFLRLLNQAMVDSGKRCTPRIFPGIKWFHGNKSYAPYAEGINKIFDDSISVGIVDGAEQGLYMNLMNEVDLVADSYPWGGSNVISDCIHLCKPSVVYEGTRWFNRIGPAMLRSIGLDCLIATNDQEYYDISHRLIKDDKWRIELSHQLHDANTSGLTERKIYNSEPGVEAFAKFIDDAMNDRVADQKVLYY